MAQNNYDIFISYRREGGFEMAYLITEKLRNAGYSVFLDVESLRAGKFNEQLYHVIEQCKDFIVVLPKDGLDRCINESDWLRKEIIYAMKYQKNIIPIMLRNFVWSSKLPKELDDLRNYQGITANDISYFDSSIDKIKNYLNSKKRFTLSKRFITISIIITAILFFIFGFALNFFTLSDNISKNFVEQSIEKQLTSNIVSFYENYDWSYGPSPAQVISEAKKIVNRFSIDKESTFEKIEAEIQFKKDNDNNWTYANLQRDGFALVNYLGLNHTTIEKNNVFLSLEIPNILSKNTEEMEQ